VSTSTELVRAYLRQRMELGDRELFLGERTATDLHELLSKRTDPALCTGVTPAGKRPAAARPSGDAGERKPAGPMDRTTIGSLNVLRDDALGCTRCGLSASRQRVVFGEGNPSAELVVVGEAPGADEDQSGRPFVGRAGKLLGVLLASAGFAREDVFICNVLKCRPPGNRNPQPEEVEACSPFLLRQIELVDPRVVLACGSFAAQTLLRSTTPIGRLRGAPHRFGEVPLVATYHPAALLRNSGWIRSAWEDLQLVRRIIDSFAG
jgi:uracil-DNA glycosylase